MIKDILKKELNIGDKVLFPYVDEDDGYIIMRTGRITKFWPNEDLPGLTRVKIQYRFGNYRAHEEVDNVQCVKL